MQVFINSENNKGLKKKRRGQLDPQETSAFLNRPVKKIENLNQSLKNSYGKHFFKESRFEHFNALKKIRKSQDIDSVASSQHNDEDYKHRAQKKRPIFSCEEMPKKLTAARQQSRKVKERRSRSRQALPAGKCSKKMAKRPHNKTQSSPSSLSRSSSMSSYKSSLQSSHNSARYINTKKADASLTDEKLDSATKQEASVKLQPSFCPQKRIAKSIMQNAQIQKYSSSELSDEPEHNPVDAPEIQSVNLMNKIINRVQQIENWAHQEQAQVYNSLEDDPMYESSIESVKMVLDKEQPQIGNEQPPNLQQDNGNHQSQASYWPQPKSIDVARSSKLTLNSKVIVESIYITSNSKIQTLPVKFSLNLQDQLAKLFLHAPCCIYSQGRNNQRQEQSQSEQQGDPKETSSKRDHHQVHYSAAPQQQDQTFSEKISLQKKTCTKGYHSNSRHGQTP